MMMLKDERLISGWLILVILLFCTFFVHNQAIFVDIMESRNLVTAREMVSDGNWLIPTMNGELRLEKPPLPTWIAAMVETVSPDNLMLQRSMAGLAAVLLVSFTDSKETLCFFDSRIALYFLQPYSHGTNRVVGHILPCFHDGGYLFFV